MTLLLAACIPAPYGIYYRPAYPDPGATPSQANRGGQAGPWSRLQIPDPDGLQITLCTDQHEEHKAEFAIELPPGARFRSPGEFPHMLVSWHCPLPLDTPIHALNTRTRPSTRLTIALAFPHRNVPRYRLRLPPFELNGQLHRLQPIDLERRVFDGGFERLNC